MSIDCTKKNAALTSITGLEMRVNRYRGKNLDGSIKLQIAGISCTGHGSIRSEGATSMTPAEKSGIADIDTEGRLICYGAKSGKRYVFIGRVERAVKPKSTASTPELSAPTPDEETEKSLIANETQAGRITIDPGCVKPDAKQLAFRQEMQRVREMKAAGIDPDVRMDFMRIYLGEGRATLYRRMKMMPPQFPKPTKRGRGSFWPLSVVESYSKGEWAFPLAQGISASSELPPVQH